MNQPTHEPRDLFAQTLRTVGILVGACVVFVGVLSVSAVAITNKAMAPREAVDSSSSSSHASEVAAPSKAGETKPAKRSQSI
jgi:hypothetical protein